MSTESLGGFRYDVLNHRRPNDQPLGVRQGFLAECLGGFRYGVIKPLGAPT
ncbi:hypothetical protein [Roseiconus lacunae]|uniref:hypothetical protein n=1 Tax=Roseiconus lacunae TaxID=2605694 RepID=UPI00135C9828|nr:hypothetical protein [Roseiconus lacunae]